LATHAHNVLIAHNTPLTPMPLKSIANVLSLLPSVLNAVNSMNFKAKRSRKASKSSKSVRFSRSMKGARPRATRKGVRAKSRRSRSMRPRVALKGSGDAPDPSVSVFSTPASFATIESNVMFMTANESVTHPSLGISGIRVRGQQPLTAIAPITSDGVVNGGFFVPVSDGSQAASWPISSSFTPIANYYTYIDLTPNFFGLGGPLAQQAALYERYRFTEVVLEYKTAVATTQGGIGGFAIIEDPATASAIVPGFTQLRQTLPNVTFPYRVPTARLVWKNKNTTLFYVNSITATSPDPTMTPVSEVESRQTINAVIVGFDSGLITPRLAFGVAGYVDISYAIEFYDPIPVSQIITPLSVAMLAQTRSNYLKSHPRPTYEQKLAALSAASASAVPRPPTPLALDDDEDDFQDAPPITVSRPRRATLVAAIKP
jgi:hypothetical protein